MNVYSSFICNSQKMEMTHVSIKKRMDKQTMAHSQNVPSNKEAGTIDTGYKHVWISKWLRWVKEARLKK